MPLPPPASGQHSEHQGEEGHRTNCTFSRERDRERTRLRDSTAGRQALLVSVSVQLKNVTSNEELLLEAEISRQLLKSMTAVNISEGGRNRNLLCGQQQESR